MNVREKQHFEANLLDGEKVEDCGSTMLSAASVWEYIQSQAEKYEAEKVEAKRQGHIDELYILKNAGLFMDGQPDVDARRALHTALNKRLDALSTKKEEK